MENIQAYLKQIAVLLEQIETITYNQTTILANQLEIKEEEILRMLEEIVEYKEEVIQELTQVENLFQIAYQQNKEELIQSGEIRQIKEKVASILQAKERIQKQEQRNLRCLAIKTSQRVEKVEIKPNPQSAINAYKKNQSLT